MQITENHQMARIVRHNEASLEVSQELGIAQSVISKLWQRFQDDGNVSRCYSTGRPELQRRMRTVVDLRLVRPMSCVERQELCNNSSSSQSGASGSDGYRQYRQVLLSFEDEQVAR
ncbi:UNVERIFIED_CONTAM: hypothetical protein NCL1_09766 [Trichonephila clavipes]